MAKINSKIDRELRKEVIEKGVFLGHITSFGFNVNIYLYENEVYREHFEFIDDDYVITDFARWDWDMVKSNITQFHPNEPYAEELIKYMALREDSLYLSNKKYREIAKVKFAELKKDYQESGLLDDINALLKKSKSKTFRYSTFESLKETRNSSQTVGELLQNATLKTKVYIYAENTHDEFEGLVDSLFNDSAYVKFLNYKSYAWYIDKNIINIYCV